MNKNVMASKWHYVCCLIYSTHAWCASAPSVVPGQSLWALSSKGCAMIQRATSATDFVASKALEIIELDSAIFSQLDELAILSATADVIRNQQTTVLAELALVSDDLESIDALDSKVSVITSVDYATLSKVSVMESKISRIDSKIDLLITQNGEIFEQLTEISDNLALLLTDVPLF